MEGPCSHRLSMVIVGSHTRADERPIDPDATLFKASGDWERFRPAARRVRGPRKAKQLSKR